MALPHLRPSIFTTRKNIYEAAIVHRRTKEDDFREKWSMHNRYFHEENVKAHKQNVWESDRSFKNSDEEHSRSHLGMEAWRREQEKEAKKLNLQQRRVKLSSLLAREREKFAAELSHMSGDNYSRLEEMKEKCETSRTERERQRKQLAEELLYEHWRSNTPEVRDLEFKQHKEHVISEWGDQVYERKKREAEERARKEKEEQELEQQRRWAVELEKEREEERLEDERQLKQVLKQQMEELREREAEAAYLKKRQDELLREQWQLEQMEEHRKQVEVERKKSEHGRILLRQHTAALRRKSQEVQKQLEEDRQFLEHLMAADREEKAALTSRREKAKADASWMKAVIEEQIKLEKKREAELDMLYQDEAARVWQKREEEWTKERLARERLMKEVLDDRRMQVEDRMAIIAEEQQESLERREELLHELEFSEQMTRRELEEQEEKKRQHKDELEAQMTSRQERENLAKDRRSADLQEERAAEQDYEEMLRQEAQRMKIEGFTGRDHSRRPGFSARSHRQAWN